MYTNTDKMKQEDNLIYNLKEYRDKYGSGVENDISIKVNHSKNMNNEEKQALIVCILEAVNKHLDATNKTVTPLDSLKSTGKIPAHTECPVKHICDKKCLHSGKKHLVDYNCKLALVLVSTMMTFEEHTKFLLKHSICPVCNQQHKTYDNAVHCSCLNMEIV